MWKNLIAISIFFVNILGSSTIQGQNKHYIGAETGIGISKEILLKNSTIYKGLKFKPTYTIGANYELRASNEFSLVSHLFLTNQGSGTDAQLFDDKGNLVGQTKRSSFLNIQLGIGGNVFLSPKHLTYGGASFNFIKGLSYDYVLTNGSRRENSAFLRRINYGFMLRVGQNKKLKDGILGLEIRGLLSLSSIYQSNPLGTRPNIMPYSINIVAKYQGLLNKIKKVSDKDKKEEG